jgi:hypothetical protein
MTLALLETCLHKFVAIPMIFFEMLMNSPGSEF